MIKYVKNWSFNIIKHLSDADLVESQLNAMGIIIKTYNTSVNKDKNINTTKGK
jgi:hypothetical protein